jgi:hypothetical protein
MHIYLYIYIYVYISVYLYLLYVLLFQTENRWPGDFPQSIYCLLIVQMEVCHLSFCVWRNKWKLLSHPPQTSLEKLFAYIQACGNRSSKTLCLIGIRRKSCDVWCFLTRYEVGAMVTTLGSKYLEYCTFPGLKYRTIIEQIIERHLYSEMHNK